MMRMRITKNGTGANVKHEIINECARLFDIHQRDIVSDARFGFLMPARFALYKALRLRGWSTSKIGHAIGGRDHSTILHGIKRAEYMMERNPQFAAIVQRLAELKPTAIDPSCLPPDRGPKQEPESDLKAFLYD